jgi:hypothetical protein
MRLANAVAVVVTRTELDALLRWLHLASHTSPRTARCIRRWLRDCDLLEVFDACASVPAAGGVRRDRASRPM